MNWQTVHNTHKMDNDGDAFDDGFSVVSASGTARGTGDDFSVVSALGTAHGTGDGFSVVSAPSERAVTHGGDDGWDMMSASSEEDSLTVPASALKYISQQDWKSLPSLSDAELLELLSKLNAKEPPTPASRATEKCVDTMTLQELHTRHKELQKMLDTVVATIEHKERNQLPLSVVRLMASSKARDKCPCGSDKMFKRCHAPQCVKEGYAVGKNRSKRSNYTLKKIQKVEERRPCLWQKDIRRYSSEGPKMQFGGQLSFAHKKSLISSDLHSARNFRMRCTLPTLQISELCSSMADIEYVDGGCCVKIKHPSTIIVQDVCLKCSKVSVVHEDTFWAHKKKQRDLCLYCNFNKGRIS